MQKITRNGLPTRYGIVGLQHLCTDEVGVKRIADLEAKYVGKQPDTAEVRHRLRKDLNELLTTLKHQGHLFRRDGDPLL